MAEVVLLDELVVEFQGDLKPYLAALDAVERSMTDTAAKLKDLWSNTWQGLGQDVNVARESTGQFTRDYTTAMQAAGASTERIFQSIEQLNAKVRENHESVRSGEQSREEYRKSLEQQRQQMIALINEYNKAARAAGNVTDEVEGTTEANKDLDDTIKSLSDRVKLQRNLWAGRVTDDKRFKDSTEALHKEMHQLYVAGGLTEEQMVKLSQSLAYAQRGLDSANKVASRGGLAWTAQIGIADAFGNSLRSLGPAGNVAAGALRLTGNAFQAFNGPLDLSSEAMKRLLGNVQGLVKALPLLGAAAAAAALTGLHRMAASSAQMATDMEVAAERTGLSTEALQEYQYAAQAAGVGAERFNTVAQRILRRAADAKAGNEGLASAFDALGVSLEDADGNLRGIDDLLGQVADGLFQVENQGERVALAFKIMDTEGSQMLNFLSAGSAGIAEMRKEARELGLVISGDTIMSLSEYGNEVERLTRQFNVLKLEASAEFLPVLREDLIPFIQNTGIPILREFALTVRDIFDLFRSERGGISDAAANALVYAANITIAATASRVLASTIRGVGVAMGIAMPQLRVLTLVAAGVTAGITALANANRDARQTVERLRESGERLKTHSGELETALGQLQNAVGQHGLETAVQSLADLLDGDAKSAFVTLAGQAIASGGDINEVTAALVQGFIHAYQEFARLELEAALAEYRLAEAAAARELKRADTQRELSAGYRSELAELEKQRAEIESRTDITDGERFLALQALTTQIELLREEAEVAGIILDQIGGTPAMEALAESAENLRVAGDNFARAQTAAANPSNALQILAPTLYQAAAATDDATEAMTAYGRSINEINAEIQEWQKLRDVTTDSAERQVAIDRIAALTAERDALLGVSKQQAANASQAQSLAGVVTGYHEAMAVAAQRESHNIAVGMDEQAAAAIRLQEELAATESAYNTLLTGTFDVTPGEGLLVQFRQDAEDLRTALANLPSEVGAATWVSRLGFEMAEGLKSPLEVIDILQPRLEELKAEQAALLTADTFDSAAWDELAQKVQIIEAALAEATAELPETTAARLIRAFQSAAEAVRGIDWQITLPRELSAVGAFAADNLAFEDAARLARLLGQEFDPLTARIEINERTIRRLNNEYRNLTAVERIWLENLSRETAALRAQQAAVTGTTSALGALLGVLSDIRVTLPEVFRDAGNAVAGFLGVTQGVARDGRIAEALGQEFNAVESEIGHLTEAVTALAGDYANLSAAERVLLTLLSNRLALLNAEVEAQEAAGEAAQRVTDLAAERAIADAVAAGQTQDAYAALMATINQFENVPADPLEAFRAQLVELGRTGHLTGAEVADGLRAITAAGERLNAANVAALTDEFETLERRVQELAGIAPTVFDDLRDSITELIEKYEAAGEEVEHLLRLLDLLDDTEGADAQIEAAQQLADTLSDVESWLRTIGDSAGGAFGQFASGLADAVSIATKFVSGDIAGGVQALVGAAIGGISDIISANSEWSNSLDQLGNQYKNLSRTAIESLAVSRQETRWFLFIPYKVRVVDEGATNEAIQTAQAMLGAVENALKSADFGADFSLGLDRIIQQELINAFLMTKPVQDAIVAFNDAIRKQDWSGAEAAYERIAGLTEEQNRLLQEQFPELYKVTDKAKEYADAIRQANRATQDLLISTAQGTLEREWQQGLLGINEYTARLADLNRLAVNTDFARQVEDLRAARDEALREQADPAYIRALEEQIRALEGAWAEALENGTWEAAQAIQQILSTSIDSLRGPLAGVFDTTVLDDFNRNWEVALLTSTRSALIQAFLHGEIMAPLLAEISSVMTEAALAGEDITAEQMKYLRNLVGQTGTEGAKFWEFLDELGLGLGSLTDEVNATTGAMRNVPNIWKGTMRQFDAVNPASVGTPTWAGQSAFAPSSSSSTVIVNQNIQGSILAAREVENIAVNAVNEEQARRGISRSGL